MLTLNEAIAELDKGRAVKDFPDMWLSDTEFMEVVVSRFGMNLRYGKQEVKQNDKIVLSAVRQNENSWVYAAQTVKVLPQILVEVFRKNKEGAQGMSEFFLDKKVYDQAIDNLAAFFIEKLSGAKNTEQQEKALSELEVICERLKKIYENATLLEIEKQKAISDKVPNIVRKAKTSIIIPGSGTPGERE